MTRFDVLDAASAMATPEETSSFTIEDLAAAANCTPDYVAEVIDAYARFFERCASGYRVRQGKLSELDEYLHRMNPRLPSERLPAVPLEYQIATEALTIVLAKANTLDERRRAIADARRYVEMIEENESLDNGPIRLRLIGRGLLLGMIEVAEYIIAAHDIAGPFEAFGMPLQELWAAAEEAEERVPAPTVGSETEFPPKPAYRRPPTSSYPRPPTRSSAPMEDLGLFATWDANVTMLVELTREHNGRRNPKN
jgi:hypothetical protein